MKPNKLRVQSDMSVRFWPKCREERKALLLRCARQLIPQNAVISRTLCHCARSVRCSRDLLRLRTVPRALLLQGPCGSGRTLFCLLLTALDRSFEAHLHAWIPEAFNAWNPHDIQALKVYSESFPAFDRMLSSWFTRGRPLKGYFGRMIMMAEASREARASRGHGGLRPPCRPPSTEALEASNAAIHSGGGHGGRRGLGTCKYLFQVAQG